MYKISFLLKNEKNDELRYRINFSFYYEISIIDGMKPLKLKSVIR